MNGSTLRLAHFLLVGLFTFTFAAPQLAPATSSRTGVPYSPKAAPANPIIPQNKWRSLLRFPTGTGISQPGGLMRKLPALSDYNFSPNSDYLMLGVSETQAMSNAWCSTNMKLVSVRTASSASGPDIVSEWPMPMAWSGSSWAISSPMSKSTYVTTDKAEGWITMYAWYFLGRPRHEAQNSISQMVSMMQTPAKKQVSTTCNNAVGLITIALDTEIQPDLRTSPGSGQGGTNNGRRLQQGTTAPAVSGTKRKPDGSAPGQPSAKQQNTGSYQNAASKPAQSVSGVLQQVSPPDTPPTQISGGGGPNAPSNQASNQAPKQYKTATAPQDYFGDLNSRTNPHSGQARVAPFTSPPDSDYFGDLKSNTDPHTGEVRDGSLPSPPHT